MTEILIPFDKVANKLKFESSIVKQLCVLVGLPFFLGSLYFIFNIVISGEYTQFALSDWTLAACFFSLTFFLSFLCYYGYKSHAKIIELTKTPSLYAVMFSAKGVSINVGATVGQLRSWMVSNKQTNIFIEWKYFHTVEFMPMKHKYICNTRYPYLKLNLNRGGIAAKNAKLTQSICEHEEVYIYRILLKGKEPEIANLLNSIPHLDVIIGSKLL